MSRLVVEHDFATADALRKALVITANAGGIEDILAESLRKSKADLPEELPGLQPLRVELAGVLVDVFAHAADVLQSELTHRSGSGPSLAALIRLFLRIAFGFPAATAEHRTVSQAGWHIPPAADELWRLLAAATEDTEALTPELPPYQQLRATDAYLRALLSPRINAISEALEAVEAQAQAAEIAAPPGPLFERLVPLFEGEPLERELDRLAGASVRFGYHLKLLRRFARQGFPQVEFHVQPDACSDCKRMLRGQRFSVAEVLANVVATGGLNNGPRSSWVVLPLLHPHCRCRPMARLTSKE